MLRTKGILTNICNSTLGKELSREDLRELQNHLIKMYRDLEIVCNQHGLQISFAFGNVLGAVRHGGWIPWDDDLDVYMPRQDYEQLLTKYVNELPSQYRVSSYHSPDGSCARFAKIYDTSTIYVSLGGRKDENAHVFIDIFPIDKCPKGFLNRSIRRVWAYFMMYTASSVMQYERKSKEFKQLMFGSRAGRINWRIRNCWGFLFSFASYKKWHEWIERFAYAEVDGKYVHVMSELTSSFKPQPADLYLPFREIELEGIGKVKVPNKTEEYLTLSYGNWREIPSDEDKWHHWVSDFKIP